MTQVKENIEEQVAAARRLAKRSRHAAEEAWEDARYEIKKHPFEAVGLGFGLGVALGAFGMWLHHNGHPKRRK